MSLDTGEAAQGLGQTGPGDPLARLRPVRLVLGEAGHVGEALKAARESLGLCEDDIGQVTRVRAAYISAIEAFDFDSLPARPFVIGYIRGYAKALGLDAEAVVARFRIEAPEVDARLRSPSGVRHDAFAGLRGLAIIGAVVATAVVVWNIARRAELHAASVPESAARSLPPPQPAAGPAVIGAPLPTPPEATTPPVYRTPGLSQPDPAPVGPSADAQAAATAAAAPSTPFAAAGAVYGANASGGGVILQARKPVTLVVRGAGGAVTFARLLAAGEAWRAPADTALVADVDDPAAVEVFVGGVSRGRLSQAQTPLSKLGAN